MGKQTPKGKTDIGCGLKIEHLARQDRTEFAHTTFLFRYFVKDLHKFPLATLKSSQYPSKSCIVIAQHALVLVINLRPDQEPPPTSPANSKHVHNRSEKRATCHHCHPNNLIIGLVVSRRRQSARTRR